VGLKYTNTSTSKTEVVASNGDRPPELLGPMASAVTAIDVSHFGLKKNAYSVF